MRWRYRPTSSDQEVRETVALTDNVYVPMRAEVIEVIQETPTIKTMVMHPARPYHFRAGQFAQLKRVSCQDDQAVVQARDQRSAAAESDAAGVHLMHGIIVQTQVG